MAAEFTLTRTVTNLSKGISTAKQHHEFMPYKLDDEISFELTDSQYFSAKAVKRETDGMLVLNLSFIPVWAIPIMCVLLASTALDEQEDKHERRN